MLNGGRGLFTQGGSNLGVGGVNLTGPDFLGRKERIVAALRDEIDHGDMERMARRRAMKVSL